MTKNQLRKKYKGLRKLLTLEEKSIMNSSILEHLKSLDWDSCTYVHIYLPLEKFNEPDTTSFIKWIKDYYPHIRLVISKSDLSSGEMMNYLLEDETKLVANNWGVLEPISGISVDEEKIDLVLVPLLVVDTRGNRVGYGKGFYDRFLQKCRPNVRTIGISFFEPVELISDIGEWDVRLNECITPSKIYTFN